jgi:O-antigen ligase
MPAPSSDSRVSVREWVLTGLLVANLVWTTLGLGGYRPETMLVSVGFAALAFAVHTLGIAFSPAAREPLPAVGWAWLPFLVYGAANVIWVTPVPWLGWADWLRWATMAAVFRLVHDGLTAALTRRILWATLAGLAVVSVLMACHQRFVAPEWLMLGRLQAEQFFGRASGPFGSPNSLAAFLVLLLPVAGALALRRHAGAAERIGWGWFAAVLLLGLVLTLSRGAWVGLALALAVWPLAIGRWRWRTRLGWAAVALAAAALATVALHRYSPQARERMAALVEHTGERSRPILWRAAWQIWREHPAWGGGAGSYNLRFERHRPETFPDDPQWAHNEYLNTLADYGAAGVALLLAGAGVAAFGRRRGAPARRGHDALESPAVRRAFGIGLLAFALHAAVDFHLKLPALGMAFAAVAALALGRSQPAANAPRPAVRRGLAGAAAAGALAAAALAGPFYAGEAVRLRARENLDALGRLDAGHPDYGRRLEAATRDLGRAVALAPTNGAAWSDLAYALVQRSHLEPARQFAWGEAAEAAADRALAISAEHYEFRLRRGVARDLQGRWTEAEQDFAAALRLAPANATAWYLRAEHLLRRPDLRDLAEAALSVCLRLDPGNAPGLALRQRLAITAKTP